MVVCAAGFVSDHLEVLYDLDVGSETSAREDALDQGFQPPFISGSGRIQTAWPLALTWREPW